MVPMTMMGRLLLTRVAEYWALSNGLALASREGLEGLSERGQ